MSKGEKTEKQVPRPDQVTFTGCLVTKWETASLKPNLYSLKYTKFLYISIAKPIKSFIGIHNTVLFESLTLFYRGKRRRLNKSATSVAVERLLVPWQRKMLPAYALLQVVNQNKSTATLIKIKFNR